ncbi:hypothetical protein K435DRAFT_816329 [Dendrothele bispora CBS 962.96]|uniref:Uncharacterized protein n=1 Tax=Dendrothele bispora (strain CBS 962.96) TaxID=1314807 RepID=A0A4S8MTC4_DENBC|nr:hypothetical protein K435DRAFT_816329 [Dendrothele bispora CBS 962.96]
MDWFYNSHETKSIVDLDTLVHSVLLADDYDRAHLAGFSAKKVLQSMDDYGGPRFTLSAEDGWHEASVQVSLPAAGVKQAESSAPVFDVPGLFYRKPLEIIKSVFQSESSRKFHFTPFKLFQRRYLDNDTFEDTRLHHELYNSDAYIQEYEQLHVQQAERRRNDPELAKEPEVENVPVGIMAWSDATQLTQFGDQSMWPIYLYFGNQSKYQRAKPSSFAAHHLGYIPKLPDHFQDQYLKEFGKPPIGPILTHIKRELMHKVWALILDPEFMHAYEYGILVKCGDSIVRRLFPRFFTYSADYPEKVLLATIRTLGRCPCPHCLTEKNQIPQLGTKWDHNRHKTKARVDTQYRRNIVENMRKWIFDFGKSITNEAVETFLQPLSWNIFSERFARFGVNFYEMLVPDVLHEIELGVWKALLTHLIRILFAVGNESIETMNRRYRDIPRFGRDTIWIIRNNVSAMKQLAARDFEDLLQVSMPVFEGLIPGFDRDIQDLLFTLNSFHSLAKLRLHSEKSLDLLDKTTTELGRLFRNFEKNACQAYRTKELRKETAAQERRNAKSAEKGRTAGGKGKRKRKDEDEQDQQAGASPLRSFNLSTFKFHALGHYIRFIRLYGTTDNYSTQIGELEHKRVKRFYSRTNKTFKFVRQIAAQEKRKRIIQNLKTSFEKQVTPGETTPTVSFQHSDALPPTPPELRYKISNDNSQYLNIFEWMNSHEDDPAVYNFYAKLKDHFFARLTGQSEGDTSLATISQVRLDNDRIYKHKVLRINYTTYDMRRSQDSINPHTNSDVMVLSSDLDPDAHPFWYARVLGIFHARVRLNNGYAQQMDVLWVRWFGLDQSYKSGWKEKRFFRIGFIDGDDPCAFGFIDPALVVRAAHLIPVFSLGKTAGIMGPSISRKKADKDEDWCRYYVGIFADRDMVVRYLPQLGLGHYHVNEKKERDPEHWTVIAEDGDPDAAAATNSEVTPPHTPPNLQDVKPDPKDANEWEDYGYANEIESVEAEEDEIVEAEEDGIVTRDLNDIGPEDGEDPINHDMEVMEAEGYGWF